MEKIAAEEGSAAARPKLLRYALRSGVKAEGKPQPMPAGSPSVPRSARGKSIPTVSKSMGVIDLSGKDKSAKPPLRRMSIPSKPVTNSVSRSAAGSVTPVSEAGSKRSARSDVPPIRDLARSSIRQKPVLSSTMYWLSQIQISESAAKHPVSLGFFKLAVEAGCKSVEKMQEELKSYVKRHDLARSSDEFELEELFERYNILESLKQLQIEKPSSDVMDEAMRSSVDEDSQSSSSVSVARKLKPKTLNSMVGSAKENDAKKPAYRVRGSIPENQAKARPRPGGVTEAQKPQQMSTKPVKPETVKGKEKPDRREKKANSDEGAETKISVAGNVTEDKENSSENGSKSSSELGYPGNL